MHVSAGQVISHEHCIVTCNLSTKLTWHTFVCRLPGYGAGGWLCYFPSTADVVPEELIWWSMPCLGAAGRQGSGRSRRVQEEHFVQWDAVGSLLVYFTIFLGKPVLRGSLVTPLLLSRLAVWCHELLALVLGLPLCFCGCISERRSVVERRDARDLWCYCRRCVLPCCKNPLPSAGFSEWRF